MRVEGLELLSGQGLEQGADLLVREDCERHGDAVVPRRPPFLLESTINQLDSVLLLVTVVHQMADVKHMWTAVVRFWKVETRNTHPFLPVVMAPFRGQVKHCGRYRTIAAVTTAKTTQELSKSCSRAVQELSLRHARGTSFGQLTTDAETSQHFNCEGRSTELRPSPSALPRLGWQQWHCGRSAQQEKLALGRILCTW